MNTRLQEILKNLETSFANALTTNCDTHTYTLSTEQVIALLDAIAHKAP